MLQNGTSFEIHNAHFYLCGENVKHVLKLCQAPYSAAGFLEQESLPLPDSWEMITGPLRPGSLRSLSESANFISLGIHMDPTKALK